MLHRFFTEKISMLLPAFCLLMIMLGSVLSVSAQTPTLVPFGRESISGKVVAVDGNIVTLSGGFTADITGAEFRDNIGMIIAARPINVGSFVKVSGQVPATSQSGQPITLKAEAVSVESGKQLSYSGTVPKVKAKKNRLFLLGREIIVVPTTRILSIQGTEISLSDVKSGSNVSIVFDSTDSGFVADLIVRLSPEDKRPLNHISGTLSLHSNNRIDLEGGFSFDTIPVDIGPEDELFNDPYYLGPGSEVGVSFSKEIAANAPKGVIQASSSFGFMRGVITIDANLQSFDANARTITVLNQTFTLPSKFFVLGPRGKTTLDKLVIGQGITLFGEMTETGFVIKVVLQPFV